MFTKLSVELLYCLPIYTGVIQTMSFEVYVELRDFNSGVEQRDVTFSVGTVLFQKAKC